MRETLEIFAKFASNLNRRSLATIAVFVLLTLLSAMTYEISTSYFALQKLASATSLLQDLESLSSSENDVVSSTAQQILLDVQLIVSGANYESQGFTDKEHRIALALIMGFPWFALSGVGIVGAFRREPDWEYGLFGCLFLGALIGSAAYFAPPSMHWFYRYILIPTITYSILLSVFYTIADDDDDDGETKRRAQASDA